ncbi:hypothetical protein PC128_g11360 [Phytophthora cactorum]|nr:hypothetical protein PC128_g11360 [Phytophthora cactorum]
MRKPLKDRERYCVRVDNVPGSRAVHVSSNPTEVTTSPSAATYTLPKPCAQRESCRTFTTRTSFDDAWRSLVYTHHTSGHALNRCRGDTHDSQYLVQRLGHEDHDGGASGIRDCESREGSREIRDGD